MIKQPRAITRLWAIALPGAATCIVSVSWADDLNVAVAANFLGTLQQLAPRFEQASGHHLIISSGSSGQLYTQIQQGAPFDVLLSADNARPKQLAAEGLGVEQSRFTYAIGTLVLWSSKPGVVDSKGEVLRGDQFRALAVADPRSAPYGLAAQQVLIALGLWDSLNRDHKIVLGENINQTWQFAATGNADMAFIALSQLIATDAEHKTATGSSWLPPQSQYQQIDQDAIILTHSARRHAAEDFTSWLHHDPEATTIIKSAGYRVAE